MERLALADRCNGDLLSPRRPAELILDDEPEVFTLPSWSKLVSGVTLPDGDLLRDFGLSAGVLRFIGVSLLSGVSPLEFAKDRSPALPGVAVPESLLLLICAGDGVTFRDSAALLVLGVGFAELSLDLAG